MNKCLIIARYEWKMQLARAAGWIIWVLVAASVVWDCYPSAINYARLSDLENPAYYVARISGQPGLLLLFGLSFLLAGRIRADQSGGMKVLFMAAPIGKAEYLLGKWLGNFLYTLSMFFVHLLVHTAAYSLLNTAPFLWRDTLLPLFSAVIYIMLPACFFVATCSVMLPAVLDVRLFYLLFSILFILDEFTYGFEIANPFYRLTRGVFMDYVCDNPFAPMPPVSLRISSMLFLLGIPMLSAVPVALHRKFWRAE